MLAKFFLFSLVAFVARANDVSDFLRHGNRDSDDTLDLKDQGVLFLEGNEEALGKQRRRSLRTPEFGSEGQVSLEQVLSTRRSARLLSELDGIAALRRELQAEAPVEGPVEAPEEAPAPPPPVAPPPPPFVDGPAEAPGGSVPRSNDDLIVTVTLTWAEGGVTYLSLADDAEFSDAYETWFYTRFGRASRINVGNSQYATPIGDDFWIDQFPRSGLTEASDPKPLRGRSVNPIAGNNRRRILSADEELHMSDLMYYSSPASDPAGDDTVRILDEVTGGIGRRLQQSNRLPADRNDGAITVHRLYFPTAFFGGYANTFSAAAGVSELINRAAIDPVLLLNLLDGNGDDAAFRKAVLSARQGQTVDVGGNDYTLPKVSASAPLTPDGRPAPLPSTGKKDSNVGAIVGGVVGGVGGAILLAGVGAIYYVKVVKPKQMAEGQNVETQETYEVKEAEQPVDVPPTENMQSPPAELTNDGKALI